MRGARDADALQGLDLNLLVAFDSLLEERSAAERLHLSQPAMSAALTRLRESFGDAILSLDGKKMHGGRLGFAIGVLAAGGSIEILDRFDPEQVLERLKFGGMTGLFMVPTHFQMIFALRARSRSCCSRTPRSPTSR